MLLVTQTNISEKIITYGADYILAVKRRQKQLLEEIEDEFKFSKEIEIDTNIDMEYARIEARKFSVISNFSFIENDKW